MDHDARINNSVQRQDSRCFVRDKIQDAIEAAGVTGNALLVLYAFSRRMTNDPEAVVHLAAEELRKRTGLSLRSIRRTLRELEQRRALVLRSKAAPGKAAGYCFGPSILERFRLELASVAERKAARAAQGTSATVADVAPRSSATLAGEAPHGGQIRPAHRPPWPPTSTDLREKNNNGGGNEGNGLRIKGKPLSEVPEGLLRFIAFEATKARPMLKVAATEELRRRAEHEARDPRQAEWDRNAQRIAEAARQRAPMPESMKQQWRALERRIA